MCVRAFVHALALEVLDAAETLELSIHHDGQSGTQCLTLLHTEREGHSYSGVGGVLTREAHL